MTSTPSTFPRQGEAADARRERHTAQRTLSWVYWEEVFGRDDNAYWWSPDGSAIAFLQSDESRVDVAQFSGFEPETPKVDRSVTPRPVASTPRCGRA